ncbi:MAG: hypothetical protein LKF31_09435 [Muribaculaceae bacterium]|jgi:hypothetical protein|nr:hypothetical protein [Muribaculaceae bacterium]
MDAPLLWDNSVGQFGTVLLLGLQLIATAFLALSRKFFTLSFTPTFRQLGGTVWDNDTAWRSTDCNGIFGLVPKVFHCGVLKKVDTKEREDCHLVVFVQR